MVNRKSFLKTIFGTAALASLPAVADTREVIDLNDPFYKNQLLNHPNEFIRKNMRLYIFGDEILAYYTNNRDMYGKLVQQFREQGDEVWAKRFSAAVERNQRHIEWVNANYGHTMFFWPGYCDMSNFHFKLKDGRDVWFWCVLPHDEDNIAVRCPMDMGPAPYYGWDEAVEYLKPIVTDKIKEQLLSPKLELYLSDPNETPTIPCKVIV